VMYRFALLGSHYHILKWVSENGYSA